MKRQTAWMSIMLVILLVGAVAFAGIGCAPDEDPVVPEDPDEGLDPDPEDEIDPEPDPEPDDDNDDFGLDPNGDLDDPTESEPDLVMEDQDDDLTFEGDDWHLLGTDLRFEEEAVLFDDEEEEYLDAYILEVEVTNERDDDAYIHVNAEGVDAEEEIWGAAATEEAVSPESTEAIKVKFVVDEQGLITDADDFPPEDGIRIMVTLLDA